MWFAVNAVMPDLQRDWGLPASAVGALTSAVQLGFIAGTLSFALLSIADRHSPRLVFLACALLGAACSALGATGAGGFDGLLLIRFATGFFLAGIYPVGMKMAAGWCPQGLGAALGRLVPDGPHLPRSPRLQWRALGALWSNRGVRASAFGYMWELYALWVLVPAIVGTRLATSGACCLLASWALGAGDAAFALWLEVWGVTVAGDSPQFSALTAANAPREAVGSLLTLVNSIGFAISIVSIELFAQLAPRHPLEALLPWLALGPALGLRMLRPLMATAR